MNFQVTFSQVESFIEYLEASNCLGKVTSYSSAKALIMLSLMDISPEESHSIVYSNGYFAKTIGEVFFPSQQSIDKFKQRDECRILAANLAGLVEREMSLEIRSQADFSELVTEVFKSWNSSSDQYSEENVRAAVEELDTNGFCVIENVLSAEECRLYRELIFDMASKEREAETAFFYGREGTLQRVYHLSAKIQELNCLIVNPMVLRILDKIFYRETWHDRYYLCSWHANIIPPGGEAQKVHIDVSVPDPIPSWMIRMNTNFLLHDYTYDNGCTMVYPGSHKLLSRPTPEGLEKMEVVPIEAPAGSLVLWSGHVWHGSGNNYSNDNRLAVLGTYTASFMREMCNEGYNLRLLTLNSTKTDKAVLDVMGVSHGIKYEPYLREVLQRCKK